MSYKRTINYPDLYRVTVTDETIVVLYIQDNVTKTVYWDNLRNIDSGLFDDVKTMISAPNDVKEFEYYLTRLGDHLVQT